jgi:hypothetical protein
MIWQEVRSAGAGQGRQGGWQRQAAWGLALLVGGWWLSAAGADSWPEALGRMPLRSSVTQLNRTNCVEIMLRAFQSNAVVKAMIFMPGATDEFYMFRRAKANLTQPAPTLFDAVSALTNQTLIRVKFQPPLLLLHTDEDPLEPDIVVQHPATEAKIRQKQLAGTLVCNDRDWDYLEPILRKMLKMDLRPWQYSVDSWHFYRHSFAASGLDGWEALEVAALAGKSRFIVTRNRVEFKVDPRIRAIPKFEAMPE